MVKALIKKIVRSGNLAIGDTEKSGQNEALPSQYNGVKFIVSYTNRACTVGSSKHSSADGCDGCDNLQTISVHLTEGDATGIHPLRLVLGFKVFLGSNCK